jgi:multiple antibiotic resistance protein
MTILSAALLLLLVMDPVGNIPVFVSVLSRYDERRARVVLLREMLIALAVLVAFLFGGRFLLESLQLSDAALSVSGGVILFLIALRMIFVDVHEIFGKNPDGEPFVVPLAVPLIAGPSAMATVLLLMSRDPSRWPEWLVALAIAWAVSGVILLAAGVVSRILGTRGLMAVERLMGMLLTTVAVQMFLTGIRQFFSAPGA